MNLKEKKVVEIGFYGSGTWIEDGYWINNDNIVFLENNTEKILSLVLINLNNKTRLHYSQRKEYLRKDKYDRIRK